MPDRDPALDKALKEFLRDWELRPTSMEDRAFREGYDAAFRSLGCATPEAQAALRELVQVALADAIQPTITSGHDLTASQFRLAALATPPEEGR